MRNRYLGVLVPALVLLLATAVLSACGSSSDNNSSQQTPAATVEAATATAEAATVAAQPSTTPGTAATGAASASATVQAVNNTTLGKMILVNAQGMTLYTFGKDSPGVSNCAGQCAANWPPLAANGTPTAGPGVTGQLSTITRSDGTMQVTYNGSPLYGWVHDTKPGDVTGDGVNTFHAAAP